MSTLIWQKTGQTIVIPQLGDTPFTGTRVLPAGSPHLGSWALTLDAGGQPFEIDLSVTEEDGALVINTSTMMGDAKGADIKFDDGILTFNVTVDAGGQTIEVAYSLKVDGDSISGTVTSDTFGESPIDGQRVVE